MRGVEHDVDRRPSCPGCRRGRSRRSARRGRRGSCSARRAPGRRRARRRSRSPRRRAPRARRARRASCCRSPGGSGRGRRPRRPRARARGRSPRAGRPSGTAVPPLARERQRRLARALRRRAGRRRARAWPRITRVAAERPQHDLARARPGSKKTFSPGGIARRMPQAAARSKRRARLTSKKWKCDVTPTGRSPSLTTVERGVSAEPLDADLAAGRRPGRADRVVQHEQPAAVGEQRLDLDAADQRGDAVGHVVRAERAVAGGLGLRVGGAVAGRLADLVGDQRDGLGLRERAARGPAACGRARRRGRAAGGPARGGGGASARGSLRAPPSVAAVRSRRAAPASARRLPRWPRWSGSRRASSRPSCSPTATSRRLRARRRHDRLLAAPSRRGAARPARRARRVARARAARSASRCCTRGPTGCATGATRPPGGRSRSTARAGSCAPTSTTSRSTARSPPPRTGTSSTRARTPTPPGSRRRSSTGAATTGSPSSRSRTALDARARARRRRAHDHHHASRRRRRRRAARVRLASLARRCPACRAPTGSSTLPARVAIALDDRKLPTGERAERRPSARRSATARSTTTAPSPRTRVRARRRRPRDRGRVGGRLPLRAGLRADHARRRLPRADDGAGRRALDGRAEPAAGERSATSACASPEPPGVGMYPGGRTESGPTTRARRARRRARDVRRAAHARRRTTTPPTPSTPRCARRSAGSRRWIARSSSATTRRAAASARRARSASTSTASPTPTSPSESAPIARQALVEDRVIEMDAEAVARELPERFRDLLDGSTLVCCRCRPAAAGAA